MVNERFLATHEKKDTVITRVMMIRFIRILPASKPQLYHLLQIIVYTGMVPPIESQASVRPTHFLNFSEISQCGSVYLVSDLVTVFI